MLEDIMGFRLLEEFLRKIEGGELDKNEMLEILDVTEDEYDKTCKDKGVWTFVKIRYIMGYRGINHSERINCIEEIIMEYRASTGDVVKA